MATVSVFSFKRVSTTCCQQLAECALSYIMHTWPHEGKNRLKAKPNYLNLTSGESLQLPEIQSREEREHRTHCLSTDLIYEKTKYTKNIQ